MRDWIIISVIGLVSLVALGWTMRHRINPSRPGPQATAPPTRSGTRVTRPERIFPRDTSTDRPRQTHVPNTTIEPLPEDRPVATLEFDGPPGVVPVYRGEFVIGRHSDDDIRVNDVRVSRGHARLVARSANAFEIHNLTSSRDEPNPMQINGERRDASAVSDGDIITLGGLSFRLRLAQSAT